MTGDAGTDDLQMVNEVSRRPDHVIVAVRTDVGRVDVRRVLA